MLPEVPKEYLNVHLTLTASENNREMEEKTL